ncbi:hypothetical protein WSM22_00730 [Cytophagales bacterium WSM2-2]|nr:hypothetical protein WSM22_00730 [Cytophagales bacterium WSM2-2]
MKKIYLLSLFVLISLIKVQAQGSDLANIDPQAMATDSLSKIKASFGVTTIGGQTYAGFRFQPEFHFGKLIGFGLDVPVQFNIDTKKFRNEEFKGGVEIVRLIRYFTLGRKKETPIYLRAGDLTGVSLGYGTLVNNYSNSPSFEARKWGVNFDFNIKGIVGVEGIYSDIKGFNMTAFRPYVRPLRTTSLPIIKTLEIGASFVSDSGKNADSTAYFIKENGIKANAFDVGITFLNTGFIKLVGYGQTSTLSMVKSDTLTKLLTAANLTYAKGDGKSAGLSAKMKLTNAFMLDARIERLWYSNYYLPQFFDAIYEINKDAKVLSLASARSKQGIYGNLGIIVLNKFRINGALLLPDKVSAEAPALVQVGLEAFQLADKITISANYIKGNLQNLDDAFTLDQRSLLNANFVYQLTPYFYIGTDYKWTFTRLENGTIKATDYVRPFFGLSFPLGGGGSTTR